MNALMNITVRIQAAQARQQIDALQAEIKALQAQMGMASAASGNMISGAAFKKLSQWGSQMQWAGRQLVANFTMPLVVAGGLVTKWVLANEAGMVRLQKVYGNAATGLQDFAGDAKGLGTAFDLLSVKYATSRADVLAIAGDWAAAGAVGASLATGVETTLKTMVLGEMSAVDSTQALIAIQAQYGADSKGLIDIIQKLNATENSTGVTFSGLVEGMARSASSAREAGVDVEHLAAMIASMSPAAGTAAQAGNALKTIFSRMLGPTGEAREVLGMMGINIDDIGWKGLNTAQRLEVLAKSYHNLSGSTDDMVSSQAGIVSQVVASRWQINKFGVLMRDVYAYVDDSAETNGYYGKTLDILSNKAMVATTAQRELNTVLESSPYAVKRAGVVIQNSLMKVVTALLPQIIWFVNSIASLAQKFAEIDPAIQKTIIGFLAFLAVLGPPLVILGSLAVAFARIGLLLKEVTLPLALFMGLFKKNTDGVSKFGIAMSGMAGKVKAAFASVIPTISSTAAAAAPVAAGAGTSVSNAFAGGIATGTTTASSVAAASGVTVARSYVGGLSTGAMGTASATGFMTSALAAANAGAVVSTGTTHGMILANTKVFLAKMRLNAALLGTAFVMPLQVAAGGAKVATANIATSVGTGMGRANFEVQRVMTQTMPAAFATGWGRINTSVYAGVNTMQRITSRNLMENLTVLNGYVNAATAVGARGAAQMGAAMKTGAASATGALVAGRGATVAAASATGTGIAARFRTVGPKILSALKNVIPMVLAFISRFGARIILAFSGPWGWAIAAVIGLLVLFRKQIGQIFENIKSAVTDSSTTFGRSWAIVVGHFNRGIVGLKKMFNSLPTGIQNALISVVNLVKAAALKVYELFSYMNPFAHHSPSLVENVTNGMAVVGRQFGLAANVIGGHMKSAYSSLQRFGSATAGFMAKFKAIGAAEDRAMVAKNAPGAVDSYDELLTKLQPLRADLIAVGSAIDSQSVVVARLEGALDAAKRAAQSIQNEFDILRDTATGLSDALDSAQTKLDDFANSPIQGMKAMNDAIWNNEMAQKALRLEMLKLGDGSSVEDLQSRLASLAGEIESVRGTANDLRAAGAGSDVLGVYGDQIKALEDQQKALDASVGPVNSMNEQLKALQKQSEILDLENSLQFDPLKKQIDDLANAYTELPFAEILAGVKTQSGQVASLKTQYDAATDAVDKQEASLNAANLAVSQSQAAYDAQAATLTGLQSVYDATEQQIRDIESAIDDVTQASNEMEQALASAAAAKASSDSLTPAGQNFLGAEGGAFPDIGGSGVIGGDTGDMQKWIDDFIGGTGDLFGQVDIFGPLKVKWAEFQGWWGQNVTPIFSHFGDGVADLFDGVDFTAPFASIGDWFGADSVVGAAARGWWEKIQAPLIEARDAIKGAWDDAMVQIGPALDGIKESFTGFGDAWSNIWSFLKPGLIGFGKVLGLLAATVAGIVGVAFIFLANIIGNVVEPVFHAIMGVVTGAMDVFAGLVNFIIGIFTGDWQRAWDGILAIVVGLWDTIYAVVEGAIGIVVGLFWGLVDGAIAAWNWLYDVLVGHSIIPDLVNAIVQWFKDMWTWVVEKVTGMIDAVVKFFTELPGKVWAALQALGGKLADVATTAWAAFSGAATTAWNTVYAWFTGLPQRIWEGLQTLGSKMADIARSAFQTLKDTAVNMVEGAGGFMSWIIGLPGKVASAMGGIGASVADAVKGAWNGAATWLNTNGIANINKVTSKLGFTLGDLPMFAKGGIVPGGYSKKDNMLIAARSGEGILTPEALARMGGKSTLDALNAGGGYVPAFAKGGVVGDTGGPLSSIGNWIKGGVGNALSAVISPMAALIRTALPGKSTVEDLFAGTLEAWAKSAKTWGDAKDLTDNPAGQGGAGGGTASSLWTVGRLLQSMGFSVSENPAFGGVTPGGHMVGSKHYQGRAIDINKGAGTSRAEQSALTGILDMVHSYGLKTLFMVPNHYNHMHAEYDNGGYLQPGITQTINKTGKPEAVFTASQWAVLRSNIQSSSSAAQRIVNMTVEKLYVDQVIVGGSQFDTAPVVQNTYTFTGNLEFPNIKSGEDADVFLRNLDDLVGGR